MVENTDTSSKDASIDHKSQGNAGKRILTQPERPIMSNENHRDESNESGAKHY